MKKNLLNRKVKVISENDNYDSFRNKVLIITHVAYSTAKKAHFILELINEEINS